MSIGTEFWRIRYGTPLTIGAGSTCGDVRCVAVAHLFDGLTPRISLNLQQEIERLAGRLAMAHIAK